MKPSVIPGFAILLAFSISQSIVAAPAAEKPAKPEKYDLTPLISGGVFAKGGPPDRALRGPEEPLGRCDVDDLTDAIRLTIQETIAADGWSENGGSDGSIKVEGNTLVTRAPAAVQQQIKGFLKQLAKPQPIRAKRDAKPVKGAEKEKEDADAPVIVVYDIQNLPARASGLAIQPNKTTREEAVESLCTRIQDDVAKDSWCDHGGSVGSVRAISGLLVIVQTPANQAEVQAKLQQWAAR